MAIGVINMVQDSCGIWVDEYCNSGGKNQNFKSDYEIFLESVVRQVLDKNEIISFVARI